MNLNVHLESLESFLLRHWSPFKYFSTIFTLHRSREKQDKYFFMVHASNIFNWEFSQLFALQPVHTVSPLLSVSDSPLNDCLNDYHEMIEKTHFNFTQAQFIATLNWIRSMTKWTEVHTWVTLTLQKDMTWKYNLYSEYN